ncbi:MAG: diaminopimelate decarboxylase [Chloroflexi bacterium]|nr:diaminopimelate decarboxylase [Chloroflexota bacterium]
MTDRLSLFPLTAEVSDRGHLVVGGCDTVDLATEFGTPLYVFDDFTLRHKCREFVAEFGQRYTGTGVVYAGKAFINRAIALLLEEEGLGLDAVSAGEMAIAHSAGFPFDRVYFHGNNKAANEVKLALQWQVGRIVVDNLPELKLVGDLAKECGANPDILLRLTPGIDPHTHQYIATGIIDSKFGFSLSRAEEAVALAMSMPEVNLAGLHFHLGSLIHEVEPYLEAIEATLNFAAEMNRKHAFELTELDIGGGFAVQYTLDSPAPPISTYAEAITARVTYKCQELGMALPHLVIEPGRAIVGQAGVALYTVGVVKDIPGVRCYVSVDGGMADNIRPALYGSEYEAVVATKMREKATDTVTIAGRFCESGDILIRDIALPSINAGDIIAIPDCGAYCLPMASNYNAFLRPAIVLVREGEARLIRRRETFDDLTRCDLV